MIPRGEKNHIPYTTNTSYRAWAQNMPDVMEGKSSDAIPGDLRPQLLC